MRPRHEIPEALEKKYGRNTKTMYHRAIRAEFSFGDELLDFSEVLHKLGFRKDCTREVRDFLRDSCNRVYAVKNILIDEINRRYKNSEQPDNSFQAIEFLELWLKDLNDYKESNLQNDTRKTVDVVRRLVKTVIKRYLEGTQEQQHSHEDET